MINSCPFLTIDIETLSPTNEGMKLELELVKPSGGCKLDASKEKSIKEKREKIIKDGGGLTDMAKIAMIGVKLPDPAQPYLNFTILPITEEEKASLLEQHILALPAESEADMLTMFTRFMDKETHEETVLVSHNGIFFDFPKIRRAIAWEGLLYPRLLHPLFFPKQFDLITKWKLFTVNNDDKQFVKLHAIVKKLGISTIGKQTDGKEFPRMVERGELVKSIFYNCLDLGYTEAAALKMGGISR